MLSAPYKKESMNQKTNSKTKISIENKINGFYKRWNVELSENEKWNNFKNRILNSFISNLANNFLDDDVCDEEFFKLIGIHKRYAKLDTLTFSLSGKSFEDCLTYKYFTEQTDIKKLLLGIEAITWMETVKLENKLNFIREIDEIIKITNIPIELKLVNSEIVLYKSGAKLLDENTVNDNLDWLVQFPPIYDTFKQGLTEFGVIGRERQVIDNLRLSLELLLKEKLNNSKSLENQQAELGKYLKSKSISSEISNMYWVIIDYYSKYQNNKIKHSSDANPGEVEFILYLTGTLMRLLLTN